MGIDFRDSSYYRRTWWSKRTVKDGEAAVKWSLGGKAREIVGPCRIRTFFATIRFLDRAKAGPFEYLRVEHRSGNVEHLRGPRALWVNPVLHERVTVEKALHLTSPAEAVVVYRASIGEAAAPAASDGKAARDGEASPQLRGFEAILAKGGPVERLRRVVVRGPTVFAPAFGERVHEFRWASGSFRTLQLSPSTLPLAAPLTTRDGATATVALRAGYEIEDVEKLLDGGGDLPAELASSLRSDLIALG